MHVTPLHIASENDHLEIAKMLLAKEAKVDIKDYNGKVNLNSHIL